MSAMNAQTLRIAIAATVGCLLSACAGIPVSSDVNPALVNSVQCHTFYWAGSFRGGPLSATLANPVNEARLRSAIETHLESLGVRTAGSNPDCLVGYGIGLGGVVEDWAWGPGWGPWWGSPYWGGPYVYPEAMVAVDLYDAHGGQPIWHAYARTAASALRGEHSQQGIDAAVTAIFSRYLH
jgi:uncharacterized protein DUF4136